MLGRRIAVRPRPPATVRDLEIALLEEWNSIPQSLIDNLIASMANRKALKSVGTVRVSHRRVIKESTIKDSQWEFAYERDKKSITERYLPDS
ncbi:hypothetical protein TNCV_3411341 [Trichonephila clavipes]|nr:hypothetical protein TNCV_3411341 [Trichonephila clavipes]